jgi:hypothetical protein
MILSLSCVVVALLAVTWLMWREIDAVRLHARAQEERADGAAGDAALWKVRYEDERTVTLAQYKLLANDRRAHDALAAELRDEIERQHELRDEQADARAAAEFHALTQGAYARANAKNCEKRLTGLRLHLAHPAIHMPRNTRREVQRLLAP